MKNGKRGGRSPTKAGLQTPMDVILYRRRRLRRRGERFSLLYRGILLAAFVWLLAGVIFGLQPMNSNDMIPSLRYGDLMLYYRLDRDFKATDVVVYEKDGRSLTGRIVAAPGDTVEITDKAALLINGSQVMESEIYYETPRYESDVAYPLTLGEDQFFILGDYRQSAMDSRYYGTVDRDEIRGIVIMCLKRVSS